MLTNKYIFSTPELKHFFERSFYLVVGNKVELYRRLFINKHLLKKHNIVNK